MYGSTYLKTNDLTYIWNASDIQSSVLVKYMSLESPLFILRDTTSIISLCLVSPSSNSFIVFLAETIIFLQLRFDVVLPLFKIF